MVRTMARKLLVAVFIALPILSFAQNSGDSFGVIIYAEGRDVTVQRDGARVSYDAGIGEALGVPLFAGDTVETDNETFVEIQLLPSRGVLKVAENTVFVIDGLAQNGETALSVVYGRLRARVSQLVGSQTFQVRGNSAVAGVRGTDFGFDQVLEPRSVGLVNNVYCFEGEVEVTQLVPASAQTETVGDESVPPTQAESVRVAAGQMVSFVPAESGLPVEIAPQAVASSLERFWTEHDFAGEEVAPSRVESVYPGIAQKVADRLGSVPDYVSESTAVPAVADTSVPEAPADTPEETPGVTVTQIDRRPAAASDTTEEPVTAEEPRNRDGQFSRVMRISGISATSLGVLADAAVIAGYYFGDDLFSSWGDWPPELMWSVALSGGGMIGLGVVMLALGLMTGN